MNRQRLRELRNYISSLSDEKFVYRAYWDVGNNEYLTTPPCGTPGCVAGHCLSMNGLRVDVWEDCRMSGVPYRSPGAIAAEYLDLTDREESFLFHVRSDRANRKDALARMDWLLAGNDADRYSYTQESWFNLHEQASRHQNPEVPTEEKQPQMQRVPTHRRGESTVQHCVYQESRPQTERQRENLLI